VIPVFLLSIATSVLSIWTQGLELATVTNPQWARTWPERLAAAGDAVRFYLDRCVTDEQRSHRHIFIATLRAGASWLFFRPAAAGLARPG